MEINGATVLLTGANGGLGLAIGRALKAEGAELIITGRREAVLAPVARELNARMLLADLADRSQVERLAEEAGRVDVLVANAALPAGGEILEYDPEQIDRALDVNLRAPIMLAHRLAPSMIAAGRGHIVMIGSLSGKTASPAAALYNATKFGLRGFALGFRQDLRGTGVGVSLVQPGFVRDAGMFHDYGLEAPAGARTVSPGKVTKAVITAIRRDRAELNVAPPEMRFLSAIGAQFPGLAERVQRRAVSDAMKRRLLESGQEKADR
jgi:short-subunit dehydrogenase